MASRSRSRGRVIVVLNDAKGKQGCGKGENDAKGNKGGGKGVDRNLALLFAAARARVVESVVADRAIAEGRRRAMEMATMARQYGEGNMNDGVGNADSWEALCKGKGKDAADQHRLDAAFMQLATMYGKGQKGKADWSNDGDAFNSMPSRHKC